MVVVMVIGTRVRFFHSLTHQCIAKDAGHMFGIVTIIIICHHYLVVSCHM
jgi:hypothetical protein